MWLWPSIKVAAGPLHGSLQATLPVVSSLTRSKLPGGHTRGGAAFDPGPAGGSRWVSGSFEPINQVEWTPLPPWQRLRA